MRNFGKDLTQGSIPKNLLLFALPVFLGNVLSAAYNIINSIWVGQLLGGASVAAAGVSFPVFMMMIALAMSGTMATSVLVAQHYGAQRLDQIRKIINTSWSFGACIAIPFTMICWVWSSEILSWIGTPVAILDMASSYLRITLLSFPLMYMSFLIISSLRAIGDSKTPLYFTVLGTILNAILDPLLIGGYGPFPHLGLNGAAWASLLSGTITSGIGVYYLLQRYGSSPLKPNAFEIHPPVLKQILGIGFPSFVQQSAQSISIAFILYFVNRFGVDATAAFGIASRIDAIVIVPAVAVMVAVSTFVAQAIGAQKIHLVPKIFRSGLLINSPMILLTVVATLVLPHLIMGVFVQDAHIIQIGQGYLRIVGLGYLFLIPIFVSNGILMGSRKTIYTMINVLISILLVRIPLAGFLSHTDLGLVGIWWAAFCGFGVNAVLGIYWYASGKWRGGSPPPNANHG